MAEFYVRTQNNPLIKTFDTWMEPKIGERDKAIQTAEIVKTASIITAITLVAFNLLNRVPSLLRAFAFACNLYSCYETWHVANNAQNILEDCRRRSWEKLDPQSKLWDLTQNAPLIRAISSLF